MNGVSNLSIVVYLCLFTKGIFILKVDSRCYHKCNCIHDSTSCECVSLYARAVIYTVYCPL